MLFTCLTHTDKLLDLFFLLLAVKLSEFCENPRRKDWSTEKSAEANLCEKHRFFCLHTLVLLSFFVVFLSTPSV